MTADPRPQPDAAQGEHSDCRCGHDWLDHTADENRQACMDLDCPCYNYAPGPPGAPASAPDAGDFEEAWRQQGGEREWEYERDGLIAGSWMKAGWKLATEAAQRQHAAEVAQRAVDHVEVLKQAGQTVVAATAALEAAQQEAARLRYELAFAAPQFHGKGEQMEGRWHCRVCGVFGQGYDTIKHRDTCPLYGYDYTTARSTLAATPPAAPPAEPESIRHLDLKQLCATCGHMRIDHDLHSWTRACQECACIGWSVQPPPADADALREDG